MFIQLVIRIKIKKRNQSNNKNKFIQYFFVLLIMQKPQQQLMSRNVSQIQGVKEVSSLSTLAYNKTPSPQLSNGPSITLTKFKSIDISEKIKKKLLMKSQARRSRRNQSLGNIQQNPENTLQDEKRDKTDFHLMNEEHLKQTKAKNFFSKLYGQTTNNTKPSANMPKPQLSNLSATLPIIHPRKPAHTTRANYLEIWLDEALDPQQITEKDLHELINSEESDQIRRLREEQPKTSASFLSTIKKYQIDRQFLKSQNVPPEVVQRLYNTLFVYTHGINNIFGELMRFVKGPSEGGLRDTMILNNFWKAFIKLLEGCTSFQTTFQKVEENYMSKISDLKEAILKRDIEHIKEKQSLENQIHRQEKTIGEWYIRYSKLQSDHKINLSTLELTDNAFNEQVQLRLKFEQKINHIYSSYQELKQKYQDMMATLNLQNEQSLSFAGQQGRLKQRIRQLQIALQEHRHLLKQQRTKVKQRQDQINLKKQQLTDLQSNLRLKAQQEISQIQGIESQININSLLKTRVQQLQNRVELSNRTNSQLSLKVAQHMATVDKYRKLNQELHGKLNSTTQSLARYEAEKIRFEAEVARLTAQLAILQQKLSILQDQNQSLQGKLQISLEQLQEKSYQVKTKAAAMQKINEAISDLKAIKQKYQTLWKISDREKQQLQHQKNKLQEKYDLQKEEIIGLKMLQENREKYIKQIQLKNDKQKQLLKRKITGYNESLTKKQSQLLAYQKSSQQKSQALLTRTYRIEQLQDEIREQKVGNQRLSKENKYLFEKIHQLETSINGLKEQIRVKNEEMEGLMKEGDLNREDLMNARNLIQVIRQEENLTVGNFKMLYEEYRRVILKKGQHVHPMIVQDLIQQLNRAKLQTIPQLHQTISIKQTQIVKIQQQNTKLSSLNNSQTQQIDILHKKVLQHTHHIDQLQKKITTLNKSNLTLTQTIVEHLTQIKQKTQKISQKEKQLKGLKQQLEESKQEATLSSGKIHEQELQIQKLNASLIVCGQKIGQLEHELSVSNRNDFYKMKVERLEKEVQLLSQRLSVYTNVSKQEQQSQTEPQGQVVIVTSSKFTHKNKFLPSDPHSNLIDQQIQASLPPFDNIPQYLDHKITQIHKEHLDKLQKQKQAEQQKLLRSNRSLNKIQQLTPKQPITRREQLRRALRVTYMRR